MREDAVCSLASHEMVQVIDEYGHSRGIQIGRHQPAPGLGDRTQGQRQVREPGRVLQILKSHQRLYHYWFSNEGVLMRELCRMVHWMWC